MFRAGPRVFSRNRANNNTSAHRAAGGGRGRAVTDRGGLDARPLAGMLGGRRGGRASRARNLRARDVTATACGWAPG